MFSTNGLIKWVTAMILLLFFAGLCYFAIYTPIHLDEIMLVDPVNRWKHGLGYTSFLWYTPGTESQFMAYLPANTIFRLPFLLTLPDSYFFHRLPFLLLLISCTFLCYGIIEAIYKNTLISCMTVLAFISDKGLWDAALSGRSEIIQVFLLLLYFYFDNRPSLNNFVVIKGLCIGLLLLTHPPVWALVPVFFYFNFKKNDLKDFGVFVLAFLVPVILYLITIRFQILSQIQQLFDDGSTPDARHGILYRISHFYERLLPYPYLNQPWVILLLIYGVYYILNSRITKDHFSKQVGMLLVTYLLFIAIASENYYRYNPPFLLCAFLLVPAIFKHLSTQLRLKFNFYFYLIYGCLLLLPLGYSVYHVYQKSLFSNTNYVVNEISTCIKAEEGNGETLLVGEPVGYYCSKPDNGITYSTNYTSQKRNWNQYQSIYVLSYAHLDDSEYELLKEIVVGNLQDGTYAGLKLYRKRDNTGTGV